MNIQNILFKYKKYFSIALLSKTIAILKESVVAYFFGASEIKDIYVALFTFSESFFGIIKSSIQNSLIPMYYKNNKKNNFLINYITILLYFLFFIFLIFISFGFYFFKKNYFDIDITLYFLIGLFSILGIFIVFNIQVLNVKKQYSKSEYSNFLISFLTILLIIILYNIYGKKLNVMIESSIFAFLIVLIIQIYYIKKLNLKILNIKYLHFPLQKKIFKNFFSLTLIFMVLHSSYSFFELYLAKQVAIGAISWNDYAKKLYLSGVFLIGGILLTPIYTKFNDELNNEKNFTFLNFTIQKIFLIFTFLAILLYLMSEILIKQLYFRGSFNYNDLVQVSNIFQIYIYSLPFAVIGLLLHNIIVSISIKTYFILNLLQTIFSFVFSIIFYKVGYGIQSLAISNFITLFIITILFLNYLIFNQYIEINHKNKTLYFLYFVGYFCLFCYIVYC